MKFNVSKQLSYILIILTAILVAGSVRVSAESDSQSELLVDVGFSGSLFNDYNRDDARAAIKVWANTIAGERGLNVSVTSTIFNDVTDLATALESSTVDLVGMTTREYLAVEEKGALGSLHFSQFSGVVGDEYLLLVNVDSNIQDVGGLRGKRVAAVTADMQNLAGVWLDTMLLDKDLPPSDSYFSDVLACEKLSKAVLSTYFGRVDGCVVTREGLGTMVELNPQVGEKLKIIAHSTRLTSVLFGIRTLADAETRRVMNDALVGAHENPRGQQILLIFGTDQIVSDNGHYLTAARNLLKRYESLQETETSRPTATASKRPSHSDAKPASVAKPVGR